MSENCETCETCGYDQALDRGPHWVRHGFYKTCYAWMKITLALGLLFQIALIWTLATG